MKSLLCFLLLPSFVHQSLSAQSVASPPTSLDACGAAESRLKPQLSKKDHVLPSASTPQGLLVFIQVSTQVVIPNCGVITRVGIDGQWAGANCSKSYFAVPVEAGEHHLCFERQTKLVFRGKAETVRTVTVSPGTTQFFKATGNVQSSAETALEVTLIAPDEAQLLIERLEEAHLKN